jgi:hypothetical protein
VLAVALTPEQLTVVRSWIGSAVPPTDDHLASRHSSLKSLKAVVAEVLRARLADFEAEAASTTIAGEVSSNHAANLSSLRERLKDLAKYPDDLGVPAVAEDEGGLITMQRIRRPGRR